MSRLIHPRIPQEQVADFLWEHLQHDLDVVSRAIGRSTDDSALTIHRILAQITASFVKRGN